MGDVIPRIPPGSPEPGALEATFEEVVQSRVAMSEMDPLGDG